MSLPEIDIDDETVLLDGQAYTREALAQRIRTMLDQGDFAVSRPSQALELLNSTLASLRTLECRVTTESSERLHQLALEQGRPVGAVIRQAVAEYLYSLEASASGLAPIQLQTPVALDSIAADSLEEAASTAAFSQPGSIDEPWLLKNRGG